MPLFNEVGSLVATFWHHVDARIVRRFVDINRAASRGQNEWHTKKYSTNKTVIDFLVLVRAPMFATTPCQLLLLLVATED